MPFSGRLTKEQVIVNSWIEHFKQSEENIEILKNLRYVLEIELSADIERNRRLNLTSISSVTIAREWIPNDQSYRNHIWVYKTTRVPLSRRHFNPVKLRFHDEDKSHSLPWLTLLALKTVFDAVTNRKPEGLLFRSEVYALRQLGLWEGIERDINKIASYIGGEARKSHSSKIRYPYLPLRDKFLLSRNEIFGILCWQGNTKGSKSTGVYGEAVGALNVAPRDIRVYAPSRTLLAAYLLRDTLAHMFPGEMLLTKERLSAIETLISDNKTPKFSLSDLPQRAASKAADVEKLIDRWRGARRFQKRRPPGLQVFNPMFAKHPAKEFVGRRSVFGAIDRFVLSPGFDSSFLVIVGESGIGKTALMANYLRDKQAKYCHYFVESKKQDLDDPKKVLRHILLFLTAKYSLAPDRGDDSIGAIVDRLNARIAEISQSQLSEGEREIIFVDAVDEIRNESKSATPGLDWLRLNLPANVGLVLTASRLSGLEQFVAPNKSNCIFISGAALENESDLREYVSRHLNTDMALPWKQLTLDNTIDAGVAFASQYCSSLCAGNFLCAKMLLEMLNARSITWMMLENELTINLDHVYDIKLDLIVKELKSSSRIGEMWQVIRLISLLEKPRTRSDICEILNIDSRRARTVFGPIERFLDLSQYAQEWKCRWFHKSFDEYVKNPRNCPHRESVKLNRTMVRYCSRGSRLGQNRDGESEQWDEICRYYARSELPLEFLKYLRRNLLRDLNGSDAFGSIQACILLYGIDAAEKAQSIADLIFFGLLYASVNDTSVPRKRTDGIWCSAGPGIRPGNYAKAKIWVGGIAYGVAQRFLKKEIDLCDFQECFNDYYSVIRYDILTTPSVEQIYRLCDHYASLWARLGDSH